MVVQLNLDSPTEFDREIFDATVPPDHYLRRVKALINFERFRPLLLSCYSPSMGRPAIEPLVLLKLEFLQFHYDLSDNAVIEQARVNLAFRFFLDLGLRDQLPDPSLMTHFRKRLGVDLHQKIFQDLI